MPGEAEPFLRHGQPGRVFWLTGLPGSGKSTLGAALFRALRARGAHAAYLDGDAVRAACGNDLGYDRADRLENAMRLARLCRMLALQGLDVVCPTVSLFASVHAWNRAELPRYLEVLLQAAPQTLRARKPLLREADAGRAEVPGANQDYELPGAPHLVLVTDAPGSDPEALARRVLEAAA